MKRRDLRLNALRAFESAARNLSFSRAAEELGVTHSAVSHQIRLLEEQLGVQLFLRSRRGIELSTHGQELLPMLTSAFEDILSSLNGLSASSRQEGLRVTTTPTLAIRWLIPRLGQWNRLDSGINLHIQPCLEYLDLLQSEADVAIRCGSPPWPGLEAEFLRPINMTPVCSPALLEQHDIREPRDLQALPLIHADVAGHELGEEWRMWFKAAGVPADDKLDGHSFYDPNIALQAAIDGQGVAMGYTDLVRTDIESGRLTAPFDLTVSHYFSYYLVYPVAKTYPRKLCVFTEWVHAQARGEQFRGQYT